MLRHKSSHAEIPKLQVGDFKLSPDIHNLEMIHWSMPQDTENRSGVHS